MLSPSSDKTLYFQFLQTYNMVNVNLALFQTAALVKVSCLTFPLQLPWFPEDVHSSCTVSSFTVKATTKTCHLRSPKKPLFMSFGTEPLVCLTSAHCKPLETGFCSTMQPNHLGGDVYTIYFMIKHSKLSETISYLNDLSSFLYWLLNAVPTRKLVKVYVKVH